MHWHNFTSKVLSVLWIIILRATGSDNWRYSCFTIEIRISKISIAAKRRGIWAPWSKSFVTFQAFMPLYLLLRSHVTYLALNFVSSWHNCNLRKRLIQKMYFRHDNPEHFPICTVVSFVLFCLAYFLCWGRLVSFGNGLGDINVFFYLKAAPLHLIVEKRN